MTLERAIAVLAASYLIVGCGTDPSSNAAAGDVADAGAEPVPVEMSELHAVDVLRACDVPMPCLQSNAQDAEGGFIVYIDTHNFECLMQSLAARIPGRYEHSANLMLSLSTTTEHVLVVGADGSTRYATSVGTSGPTTAYSETFQTGKLCALQPASFFEACALALETHNGRRDSEAWQCAFTNIEAWFEHCDEQPQLTCE